MRKAAPLPSGIRDIATSVSSQLRALAGRVRRVGLNGRFDPEAAFIERDELAHALRRLADRLERHAGQLPTAAPASTTRAVLPKRFAAALAAKASEIASLRALLAQAVRPGRRRRRPASEAQLMLPLRRPPMTAEEFLEHAAALVTRRRREYGEPVDLFEQVAKRWSLTLGTQVSPAQVVLCLIDLKVARLARDPGHFDSQADVAGYAAVPAGGEPMTGPAGYRSCLARAQARSAPTDDDLLAMRRAAWRKQGVIMLRPEEVRDDWTRQALINEANRLYGRRPGGER